MELKLSWMVMAYLFVNGAVYHVGDVPVRQVCYDCMQSDPGPFRKNPAHLVDYHLCACVSRLLDAEAPENMRTI